MAGLGRPRAGPGREGLTVSTGKHSQLVPVLILIQADGTHIILVS